MKTLFLIIICLIPFHLFSQGFSAEELHFPLFEDSLRIDIFLDQRKESYVIDKVSDIYKKFKVGNHEIEIFSNSDTSFYFRKFANSIIIEEGNMLFRRTDIPIRIDSFEICGFGGHNDRCADFVANFYRPIRVLQWKFLRENGTKEIHGYNMQGQKHGFFQTESITGEKRRIGYFKNELSSIKSPTRTDIVENIKWLYGKEAILFQFKVQNEWNNYRSTWLRFEKNKYKSSRNHSSIKLLENNMFLLKEPVKDEEGFEQNSKNGSWRINSTGLLILEFSKNEVIELKLEDFGRREITGKIISRSYE